MRLPHLLLLLALAVGVTACGDDEPSATPTSAAPTPSPSEPTSEPTTEPTSEPPTSEPSMSVSPVEPSDEPTTEPAPEPTQAPTTAPPVEPTRPPGSTAPSSYAEARALIDTAGGQPQQLERFRTPTSSYCLVDYGPLVGCELRRGGIPDPAYCGDGPTQNIGRILFDELSGKPTPECNSDTVREPGAPRLPAGSVVAANGVECLVEADAVLCVQPSRRSGFYLGGDDYSTFTS
ncbi:hypothetical protein [Nocardioides litoris]|uniref:hypothetical protein n=1 Tax=Nocardioides litoris TaxID=1926648 RepID=UPI001121C93A|nr:hypothetical protein [Nocardioides litoris]